jgi:hypothetical protein
MCQVEPRVPHIFSILIFPLYTLPHTIIITSVLHYQQATLAFQLNRLQVAKEDVFFLLPCTMSAAAFPCPADTKKRKRITDTTLHYITLLHYTTLRYTTLRYATLHYATLHYTAGCYLNPRIIKNPDSVISEGLKYYNILHLNFVLQVFILCEI